MRLAPAFALCALLLPTAAQSRGKPADVSWAKPGVDFTAYQRDALECANKTYGLDVSVKPRTVAALAALNGAELSSILASTAPNTGRGGLDYQGGSTGYAAAMSAVEPGRVLLRTSRYTETFRHAASVDVVDQLQAVLDYCLAARGYHRFRLSADQRRELRRYAKGSEARARYLHALASAG